MTEGKRFGMTEGKRFGMTVGSSCHFERSEKSYSLVFLSFIAPFGIENNSFNK